MAAEKIALEAVTSSSIAALGYNGAKLIAAVEFRSGEVWHYAGVGPELMLHWYAAASIGQFYAHNIKGKFQAEKMTGHCPKCGAMGWIAERCADCGCADVTPDPRKVLHVAAYDQPVLAGRNLRAECGATVRTLEIARNIEAATCEKCLARVNAREGMEV